MTFNLNYWDDVTTSEIYAYKSKILHTINGTTSDTWRSILSQFKDYLDFNSEMLFQYNYTDSDGVVTVIAHQTRTINLNVAMFSCIEVDGAGRIIANTFDIQSNSSKYITSIVDSNGFTTTNNSANNLPRNITFTLYALTN